ncbi:hypothetical protein [Phenylobacterium montanum]|uniref:Uncharacterized protein n=1 Tax=Phenylobacterium montanum TaxID=2823693 RepID=A0A975IU75_9CAUL|nr:hypothetical protein [Caulobacter sp. S6]QUD85951.1 hypothetical protein KCG34_12620 [Caulobacter sp. S6]
MHKRLDQAIDDPAQASQPERASRTLAERVRRPLMVTVPALVLLAGAAAYLAPARDVSTNDAFVRATKGSINARVSG